MLSVTCLKIQSIPNSGLPASAHFSAIRLILAPPSIDPQHLCSRCSDQPPMRQSSLHTFP